MDMFQLLDKLVNFFIISTVIDVVLFIFLIILFIKMFNTKIISRENNVEIAALVDKVDKLSNTK